MTVKNGARFEEKLICCFKNVKNLVTSTQALKSLQNLHFDWIFLCIAYNGWSLFCVM